MLLRPWILIAKVHNIKLLKVPQRFASELSSLKANKTNESKKTKTNKDHERKISKEMMTRLNAQGFSEIAKKFPVQIFKKKSKAPDGLYIACDRVAAQMAEIILKDLNCQLIETNPGIGFLSKRLMNGTNNNLLLFEPIESFHDDLTTLIDQNSSNKNVLLRSTDLSTLWRMEFIDKVDKANASRVDEALRGIGRKDYEDEPNARIFMATCSLQFLKHLINSVISQTGILSLGRPELFLCLPPHLFRHLTCSNEAGYLLYRSTSVLFQLLFEYEFIGEFDRNKFLPWQSEAVQMKGSKMGKYYRMNPDKLFLMRAVPRRDLFHFCVPENLSALWFFVKQNFMSRKNRVIPTLERWVPGCGPRLIVNRKKGTIPEIINSSLPASSIPTLSEPCRHLSNENYFSNMNIFTEFGDLTPSQVLTLFNEFSKWPEYRECSFNASLENMLLKGHSNFDNRSEELEDDDEDAKNTTNVNKD